MKRYRHSLFIQLAVMALIVLGCKRNSPAAFEIHKSATGSKGMVVTAHPLASEAGLHILRQGGNAADAAIAVQLALAVVYPRAGNLGGGGFMVYRHADGTVTTLDFREKAPLASHRDMYLDSTGSVIPNSSTTGILAAGIPGTVAGLAEMYRVHGGLTPWPKLFEPAIHLAEKGFRLTALEADRLNRYRGEFLQHNPAEMPFISNKPWKEGDLLRQKELAGTLRLLASEGRKAFYAGPIKEMVLKVSQEKNGCFSDQDFVSYEAEWRAPVSIRWRDFTLYTMGLPSSGGILLSQILAMIDPMLSDSLGHHDPYHIHLLAEAERRAYADRAAYLGDADYYPVAVDTLKSISYLLRKWSDFDPGQATPSHSIYASSIQIDKETFETTHLSITDALGNAIAITTTLNDNYGCKVWVPEAGFFLNNEMDDFSIKPGTPNLYGLIGGEANAIAPGKRMLSSMTPTIVEHQGHLYMALGSPGGSTIITSVLQVFLNKAVFGMSIDSAVSSSRYHHQWLPDEILVEEHAFDHQLQNQLIGMGHKINEVHQIGLIEAIWIDSAGTYHGAADPRGDDHATGW